MFDVGGGDGRRREGGRVSGKWSRTVEMAGEVRISCLSWDGRWRLRQVFKNLLLSVPLGANNEKYRR